MKALSGGLLHFDYGPGLSEDGSGHRCEVTLWGWLDGGEEFVYLNHYEPKPLKDQLVGELRRVSEVFASLAGQIAGAP